MPDQNKQNSPGDAPSLQDFISQFFQQNLANLKFNAGLLFEFLKNPVLGMKNLPPWQPQETLFLHGLTAAVSGVLGGLLSIKFLSIILGLLFMPITVIAASLVFSGFFYYLILFFFKKQPDFFTVYKIHFLASLPVLAASTVAHWIPPVSLVALIAAFFLIFVGLSENFQLERRSLAKVLGGVFLVYILMWVWGLKSVVNSREAYRHHASPESLDLLEKELNDKYQFED